MKSDVRQYTFISFSLFLGLVLGCTEEKHSNPMGMKFSDTYIDHPRVIADPNNQPPVLTGSPPLVYRVGSACTVRVIDVDVKKQLASHEIGAGGIVLVDVNKGIRIGDEFTRPNPLDPAGHYAIYLDR